MTTAIRQKRTRWLASLFNDLSHEAVTAVLPALVASMGVRLERSAQLKVSLMGCRAQRSFTAAGGPIDYSR